jgi:hypothetical protein
MLEAMLLGAFLETQGLGPRPVACSFPGTEAEERAIEIVLTPRPSLKDVPGLYRVEMAVNGGARLRAAAQPIATTDGRDVLVQARSGSKTHYTVGIDAEGRAALNVMIDERPEAEPREAMRTGHCRNHEAYIERWSGL